MDSANFQTLAGRLVRDAIARNTLNPDTGAAFITEAQRLIRLASGVVMGAEYPTRDTFSTTPMVMADTTTPPTLPDEALKSARANAFAKRMGTTDDG